jgi:hypothetical protein
MKLPRFTESRLMVAVAMVAIALAACLWMHARAASLRRAAQGYRERLAEYRRPAPRRHVPSPRVIAYYMRMVEKCEPAARRPWLPVEPDAPEPEE